MIEFEADEFQKIRSLIYDESGISLSAGKKALVRSRLTKRIRHHNLNSFGAYLRLLENKQNNNELIYFIDVLTTNKTSFFREPRHFDFIADHIIPKASGRPVRWWNAGCSSGQESVSSAITWAETTSRNSTNLKILGTDLSSEVLTKAKRARYRASDLNKMDATLRSRYFNKMDATTYEVVPQIQRMITYGRLNLMTSWPLKGPFQLIMCRNVMIYFDEPTRITLARRFRDLLEPDGHLIIGHTESIPGKQVGVKGVGPSIYKKV